MEGGPKRFTGSALLQGVTSAQVRRFRFTLLVLLLALAAGLVVVLYIGIDGRGLRILVFLGACLACVAVVVLLPARVRRRFGLPVTVFVGVAGVLPLVIEQDSSEPPETKRFVNVDYATELLGRGPFTGEVPPPLTLKSMTRESVDDAAATAQVALEFATPASDGFAGANAYLFLHPTADGSLAQSKKMYERYRVQYAQFGEIQGDSRAFFQFANGEIIAGGVRDYLYCEASIYPDSNVNISVVEGLTSACLNYGEDVIRLATN